ncbi:MAG: hypothetical protein ACLGXA_01040 [Acidobacteriota bacterium]
MPPVDLSTAQTLRRYLPEIAWSILTTLLILFWILRAHQTWLDAPGLDWNSSEWMITYRAGFIRRGLGGSSLHFLIRATHLSFFTIWAGLTTAIYAGICLWFVRSIARLRGPAVWRAALLFNPMFFLFGAASGTFLRKDMLFVAASIAHVECARRLRASRSRAFLAGYLVVFAIAATLLALLHEADFLFVALAINAALLWRSLRLFELRRGAAALLLALTLIPSLTAAGAAIIVHGNAAMSRTIRDAWVEEMPPAYRSESRFPPEVYFLGANMHDQLRGPEEAAWQAPLFLGSFALLGLIAALALPILVPGMSAHRVALLLILPLLAGLPMGVIVMDWGRWFADIVCCVFPLLLHPDLVLASPLTRPRADDHLPGWAIALRNAIQTHPALFAVALVCCPLPPWPCPNPLLAYNPFFLLLVFGHLLHIV